MNPNPLTFKQTEPRLRCMLVTLIHLFFWSAIGSSGILRAQTIPDDEAMRILQQLDELEAQIKSGQQRVRGNAVQRFRAAAASQSTATEFFLECVHTLDFESRNARASEFRDWRERNRDNLDAESHALALQIQLQYLVLSLRAAETDATEMGPIVADLQQFIINLAGNYARIAPHARMLQQPVTNSQFARAYQLDRNLVVAQWEMTPLNHAGIFDKTILPHYREHNPEQLGQAWEQRVRVEQNLAQATTDEAAYERFVKERVPELQWARARDLYDHGFQPQAISEMLAIVRNNIGHPDAATWIGTLRGSLVETFNTQASASDEVFSVEPDAGKAAGAADTNASSPVGTSTGSFARPD